MDFDGFVAARGAALLRMCVALTGSVPEAEVAVTVIQADSWVPPDRQGYVAGSVNRSPAA
jgi:hypothetical protein